LLCAVSVYYSNISSLCKYTPSCSRGGLHNSRPPIDFHLSQSRVHTTHSRNSNELQAWCFYATFRTRSRFSRVC
jgi:hypothetical protein